MPYKAHSLKYHHFMLSSTRLPGVKALQTSQNFIDRLLSCCLWTQWTSQYIQRRKNRDKMLLYLRKFEKRNEIQNKKVRWWCARISWQCRSMLHAVCPIRCRELYGVRCDICQSPGDIGRSKFIFLQQRWQMKYDPQPLRDAVGTSNPDGLWRPGYVLSAIHQDLLCASLGSLSALANDSALEVFFTTMRYINRHYLAIHPSTVNNDKLFSLRRESRRFCFVIC